MRFPRMVPVAMALASSLLYTGCLVKRRVITRKGQVTKQALLSATKEQLLEKIRTNYEAVESLNATVDLAPVVGSAGKGQLTEYKDVRGYILYKRPSLIRIIGLYPVVRGKAFDMVSDGKEFKLYLPAKNRFVQGQNNTPPKPDKKLENLRPQHFLEALVIQPPAENETPVLYNLTDEETAAYVLEFIAPNPGGGFALKRQIWFDRLSLETTRQLTFDAAGEILTDARYSKWKQEGSTWFPNEIEIIRPKDEYGVVMTMQKLQLNPALGDAQFTLDRPEGTELQVIADSGARGPTAK